MVETSDNPFPKLIRDLTESAEDVSSKWSGEAEDWEKNEISYEKWGIFAMNRVLKEINDAISRVKIIG